MSDRVHIYRGTNRRFHVLVRGPGCRKSSRWKRGVVTFISDYYDPTPIFWMHR